MQAVINWSLGKDFFGIEPVKPLKFLVIQAENDKGDLAERQVANDEKLLSLFEPDIHVIVRGKAGAEVEFGNLLVLGEQIDGLIWIGNCSRSRYLLIRA
jgi:hypothetical protein